MVLCYVRMLLFSIVCFSQGSVATHCRYGGNYDTNLVTNLLLSPTVKEFLKSVNIYQSYERISSVRFFMAHGVVIVDFAITSQ